MGASYTTYAAGGGADRRTGGDPLPGRYKKYFVSGLTSGSTKG